MGINVCMKDVGEVALGAAAHEVSNMASRIGQGMEVIGDNAEYRPALSSRHPDFGDAFKYWELCGHD